MIAFNIMKLLLILFLLTSFRVYALDGGASKKSSAFSGGLLLDQHLLSQAKTLEFKDPATSLRIATQALTLSQQNNHADVSAKLHVLLAEMAKRSKNNEQAFSHLLQAANLYQSLKNTEEQILVSIDYIDILVTQKHYQEAHEFIDKLLVTAKQYQKPQLLALTLMTKAMLYYRQEKFQAAIHEYEKALIQLSGSHFTVLAKRADTYKKIAQSYKRLKNKEKTVEFYKKSLQIFISLNNKQEVANTLHTLAQAERYLGHSIMALDYSMQSLQVYKEVGDVEGYNKALIGAGIIYRHIGRYEKSLEYVYKAYTYYKKKNDINGIAETSNQLGFIYTRLKQYKEARQFYQVAIDISGKGIDKKTLASSLREMAVVYLNEEDYEIAMSMAEKAHKIYQETHDDLKASITARIIGHIYRGQKKNKQAMAYYKKSLDYAKKSGDQLRQIKAETALAGLLVITDPIKGIKQLKKALALSVKIGNKSQMLQTYSKLHLAEKSLGNINDSLRYAEAEIDLGRALKQEENEKELILVKAKLYSQAKEIELTSLKEKAKLDQLALSKKNNEIELAKKNRKITELELKANKYANITLASLLGLALLSMIIIYCLFMASKRRNKELDYLATRDSLTNCFNRRALFEYMYQGVESIDKLENCCIIMVDIDHFKNVNDTYGHGIGDNVICGVAEVLKANINERDMVARFGGEEFCVYLYDTDVESALEVAEEMRRQVEQGHFIDVSVTCCFGVSSIKFNAKSYLELIAQADLALYQSKLLGRNQVTLWTPSLEKAEQQHKTVNTDSIG